ncbi:MAG: TMEM175 family protein [Candidatus Eiseniibacteriota bacterium]
MTKNRLEAFSDGVIAIIITIMVLELKVPHEGTLAALRPLMPQFLGYLLSFVYLGIYWNNHHHLLHAAKHVDGRIMWANLHLLFWLSLVPFCTAWIAETHLAPGPAAFYGLVLLAAAFAYFLLTQALLARHGRDSALARAVGVELKEKTSLGIYVVAVALAYVNPVLSYLLYSAVAAWWIIPDRRIERALAE